MKKVNKKWGYGLLFIVAVLILFLIVLPQFLSNRDQDDELTVTGIPVQSMEVETGVLRETVRYTGSIEPDRSVTLSAQLAAVVKQITHREGDTVELGKTLVALNDERLTASYRSLEQNKARLEENSAYLNREIATFESEHQLVKRLEAAQNHKEYLLNELEKIETLYEYGAVSETEYEKLAHEVKTAESQYQELQAIASSTLEQMIHEQAMNHYQVEEIRTKMDDVQLQLNDTKLEAPFSGQVRKVFYEEGDLAAMGQPVVIIDDISKFLLRVTVSETDLVRINEDTAVSVKLTGTNEEIDAKISSILPDVHPVSRVGEVKISLFPDSENRIFIGAGAQASIHLSETHEKDVIIPSSAIRYMADYKAVYVIRDQQVEERRILAGMSVDGFTQIVEGLEPGEVIATKNLNKLYDGAHVTIFRGVHES